MGFLQINIGLIFLVLYFSMLSLMQILKLRRQTRSFDILCSLGKSQTALNRWLDRQILINLGLPVLMSVVLLGSAAPVVNFELNRVIPVSYTHLGAGDFRAAGAGGAADDQDRGLCVAVAVAHRSFAS